MPTITVVGAASGATNATTTNSVTPTLPSGTTVGDTDRVYVFIGVGPGTSSVATPTGWTADGSVLVGTTATFGSGAGPRRAQVFYRDRDTTWTMPTFSFTSVTGATISWAAMTVRKGATDTWETPVTTSGSDTSSTSTAFQVTGATNIGFAADDLYVAFGVTSDPVTVNTPVMSVPGCVLTTPVEQADGASTGGNDVGTSVYTASVTSGTSTGAPGHQLVTSAATDGGALLMRLRSTAAPASGGGTPVVRTTANGSGISSATTVPVTRPGTVANGDLLIAFQTSDADGNLAAMGAPTGWTQIGEISGTTGFSGFSKVWTRTASSEPTTWNFTKQTGSTQLVTVVAIQAGTWLPGQTLTETLREAASATAQTTPSITGAAGNLLLCFWSGSGGGGDTARTRTMQAGMTEHSDVLSSDSWVSMGVASQALTTTGATGTRTSTLTVTEPYMAGAIAIVGAPSGATADVDLTGTGQLTATVTPRLTRTAGLTGAGQLTATGTDYRETESVGLSGSGQLSAVALGVQTRAASLSGSGVLTATVTPFLTRAAGLFGSGQLTGTSGPTAEAGLTGSGQLTATTSAFKLTQPAAVTGSGALTAVAIPRLTRDAALSGSGQLAASATPAVSPSLTGSGQLTATIVPRLTLSRALNGQGFLSAFLETSGTEAAAFFGSGQLTATTSNFKLTQAANLTGSGALVGQLSLARSAVLAGAGQLTATVVPRLTRAASLSGAGQLVGQGLRRLITSAAATGVGQLTARFFRYLDPVTQETQAEFAFDGLATAEIMFEGVGTAEFLVDGTGTGIFDNDGVGSGDFADSGIGEGSFA